MSGRSAFTAPAPDQVDAAYRRSLDFDIVDDTAPVASPPTPVHAAAPVAVVPVVVTTEKTLPAPSQDLLAVRVESARKRDGFIVDLQAVDHYIDQDALILLLPENQTRIQCAIGTKLVVTLPGLGSYRVVWSGSSGVFRRVTPCLLVLSFIRVSDSV